MYGAAKNLSIMYTDFRRLYTECNLKRKQVHVHVHAHNVHKFADTHTDTRRTKHAALLNSNE